MKKIVIGTTGFIGSAIVRDLLCQGHDVRESAARQPVSLCWIVVLACMSLLATTVQASEPSNPDARFGGGRVADMTAGLESGFHAPPIQLGPWVYWRWPWSYAQLITEQGITDDLCAMREQEMGGVLIDTVGHIPHPEAAPYMSDAWLTLIAHAHRETQRLGLGFYIHASDGWANAGGPWITPEDAMKVFTFSKVQVKGPVVFDGSLPQPDASPVKQHQNIEDNEKPQEEYYRDVAVLAYDCSNPNAVPTGVINLTDQMSADGLLQWQAPAGDWTILRFGWKITGARNAPATPAGTGLECDKLGRRGMDAHLKGIEPILRILEDSAEGLSSFIGIDSWEAGDHNWTQSMPEEFKAAKGYDLIPWLPVLAGDLLSPESSRFLADFDDMIQEMVRSNYIGYLTERMHERGIRTQCQSVPEYADIPCGEYWAESPSEKVHGPHADLFKEDPLRAFAMTTAIGIGPLGRGWGKNVIGAESFTSRCQNWERTPFALKSGLDWALCSGVNKTIFHLYAIQPDSNLKPHYMEHGTGVNRNLTWWNQGHAWFDYIARAQFMLRRGTHVSDVCYIGIPNSWRKIHDQFPAPYRYDFAPWSRLVRDMSVKDGLSIFPEGAAYKLIVVENGADIGVQEIQKVEQVVKDGAAVLAQQKPRQGRGLVGFPECDAAVTEIANTLWGRGRKGERRIGEGRFLWGYTPQEALELIGIEPDFSGALAEPNESGIDWVHRRDGDTDIYFVVNRAGHAVTLDATFRVTGKAPELWDPDSAETQFADSFSAGPQSTTVPLRLEAYASVFIVFRGPGEPVTAKNPPTARQALDITGPWEVAFLDGMGAPASIQFTELVSWTDRPEVDIQYYSGQATYTKTIHVPAELMEGADPVLDLGDVRDLVAVNVNGRHVRTLWKPPYRVALGDALKPGRNEIELTVANTWINRFIGDFRRHGRSGVTPENAPRYTLEGASTQDYNENTPILESGLLGPVRIYAKE